MCSTIGRRTAVASTGLGGFRRAAGSLAGVDPWLGQAVSVLDAATRSLGIEAAKPNLAETPHNLERKQ
jgi:hypothetical protein